MRLADLEPKWWAEPGRHGQGIVFLCPHCRLGFLCIAFANPLDGGAPWDVGTEQRRPISKLWDVLYGELGAEEQPADALVKRGTWVVPPGCQWTRSGDTFETLSLTPSVDASRAGCWHGFVTKGAIT